MADWRLLRTPRLSGPANMEFDLGLFHDFEKGLVPSTLRIYSWRPRCISLGYSQKIEDEIDLKKAKSFGWDVVRRPTGGGIVFHNEAEVTYSLVTAIDNPLLPKGLVPSYKKISEAIVCALREMGIISEIRDSKLDIRNSKSQLCFSYPAEYEIVVNGKKIVGSAQKRGRKALLQQGSIFVRNTDSRFFSVLNRSFAKHNAVSVEEILGRAVGFEELSEAMIRGFRERLGIEL